MICDSMLHLYQPIIELFKYDEKASNTTILITQVIGLGFMLSPLVIFGVILAARVKERGITETTEIIYDEVFDLFKVWARPTFKVKCPVLIDI